MANICLRLKNCHYVSRLSKPGGGERNFCISKAAIAWYGYCVRTLYEVDSLDTGSIPVGSTNGYRLSQMALSHKTGT